MISPQANKLISLVHAFETKRILVLGDVMLDIYEEGDSERISPEAPVPIISIRNERHVPGGASNTANNIRTLGAAVTCVGVIGKDENGKKLASLLESLGIDNFLFPEHNRKTTAKTRIVAQNQQIVRIDKENKHYLQKETEQQVLSKLDEFLDSHDAIIISDYAKGMVTEGVCKAIIQKAKQKDIPVIVDPRPSHASFYTGAFVITPNNKEAAQMAGMLEENGPEIDLIGNKLRETHESNVLITRGAKGMSLFELGKDPIIIPTKALEVIDVSGAGDTVVAAIGLALSARATLHEASIIANYAAGVVVGKRGTSSVSKDEIIQSILKDSR